MSIGKRTDEKLLDKFAGQVMRERIAANVDCIDAPSRVASRAYQMAAAMLKARREVMK